MTVSGLELIYSDQAQIELAIVNPRAIKIVCRNSGFLNQKKAKEIAEWAKGKLREPCER